MGNKVTLSIKIPQKQAIFMHLKKNKCYTNIKMVNTEFTKNHILDIDGTHLDHIVGFPVGGNTSLGNGQFTHRFCNLQKR